MISKRRVWFVGERLTVLGIAALLTTALASHSCGRVQKPPIAVIPGASGMSFRLPPNWKSAPWWPGSTAVELDRTHKTASGEALDALVIVYREHRMSHAEAIARLTQIGAEAMATPSTFLLIDGWPALQRRVTVTAPRSERPRGEGGPETYVVEITTAIAVDDLVIRLEGSVPVYADTSVSAEVEQIGRNLSFAARPLAGQSDQDLQRLLTSAPSRSARPGGAVPNKPVPLRQYAPVRAGQATSTGNISFGEGELEVAASADGSNVVVAGQDSQTFFSKDGGLTFGSSALTGRNGLSSDGDPSVTVGASGAFYLSFLDTLSASGGGCGAAVLSSPKGRGDTFSFLTNAVLCPGAGDPHCLPDMEHLTADPKPGKTGADQVYLVFRKISDGADSNCSKDHPVGQVPSIVCSSDSGMTWTAPKPIAAGDFPRVAVGKDGFVWVVMRSHDWIVVHKFSSCDTGLLPQDGFPKGVVPLFDPTCPVAGLDRCEPRLLSSATIAADQDSGRVFVAYAASTPLTDGNDDVIVVGSKDGTHWPDSTATVSSPTIARRFMPWMCLMSGDPQVGWYERKPATGGQNDLTDYVRGGVQGTTFASQATVTVSRNSDAQCAPGFPCGALPPARANACWTPVVDGTCQDPFGNGSKGCDQGNASCAEGEKCVPNGQNAGCPMYGDYNGIACSASHVFATWASATLQGNGSAPAGINLYVDSLCGQKHEPCCPGGAGCSSGLACVAAKCEASPTCGVPGLPCCANGCTAGSGCSAGNCVQCPAPTSLVDVEMPMGSDCVSGHAYEQDHPAAAQFTIADCKADVVSDPVGFTCSATKSPDGGFCKVTWTTPQDCSGKQATCHIVVTQQSLQAPQGCRLDGVCGQADKPCCPAGDACSSGLSCTAGTCTASAACGTPGLACCANGCTGGSVCSAGKCVQCPGPTSLVEDDMPLGSDCLSGHSYEKDYSSAAGLTIAECNAKIVSAPVGFRCSATPSSDGRSCRVVWTTPQDCSGKYAKCHVVVTQKSPQIPPGCPGSP